MQVLANPELLGDFFRGLKKEFHVDNDLRIENSDKIPKIGFLLHGYQILPDSEMKYLVEDRMNIWR